MKSTELTEALERFYHRTRDWLGLGLHKFVRDEEDDARKFNRRLHVHLCLLTFNGCLSYFSVIGMVSVTVLTSATTTVLILQEVFDRAGKF